MNSQRPPIQSDAPSATALLPFKWGVLRSPILGVMGVLGRWDLYQSTAHTQLPHTSQNKV